MSKKQKGQEAKKANKKSRAETRQERIERLKRRFEHMARHEKIREYVRYERALIGILPGDLPPREFIEETLEALDDVIKSEFDGNHDLHERFLKFFRNKASKPFLTTSSRRK